MVSKKQGVAMASKTGCVVYIECSAIDGIEGVKAVFDTVIGLIAKHAESSHKTKKKIGGLLGRGKKGQKSSKNSELVRARALYDFKASSSKEMDLEKGDVMTVHRKDGGWWEVELNGKKGYVPGNYLEELL